MLANHPNVLGGGGVATNIIGGTGLFADGTVAAPSISFLADQDTGIYRIGANNLGVSVGGALAVNFTSGLATFAGPIILGLNDYIGESSTFALQFGGNDYGFKNTTSGYSVVISNSAPTNSLVIAATTGAATFVGAVTISSATAGSASAGAILATGGVSAKNLFITAAVATYDNTNPSIAFTSAGGALGFYSQSNTVYFASTSARIMGFTNAGLYFSINGDVTSPNIATDAAGASGFFAPANGGIAYSGGGTERFRIAATTGLATFAGAVAITGNVGFYGQAATAKPTGVAVSAAAIHAALVTLNLIAA